MSAKKSDQQPIENFKSSSKGMSIREEEGWKLFTNFRAKVEAEHVCIGIDESKNRTLTVRTSLDGKVTKHTVPYDDFQNNSWIGRHLGLDAKIDYKVIKGRYTLAEVITELSPDKVKFTEVAKIGIYKHEGEICYVHSGGAITANGTHRTDIKSNISGSLKQVCIPSLTEGDDPSSLVEQFLEAGKISEANPCMSSLLFASATRAPLTDLKSNTVVPGCVGNTGVFKTSMALVWQACFSPSLKEPICNFNSTARSTELTLQQGGNTLIILDDLTPKHTGKDTEDCFEIVFGGVGNGSGRTLKNSTTTNAIIASLKSIPLITGEIYPNATQSRKERIVIAKVEAGDVELDKLTNYQKIAASGALAKVIGMFIAYILSNYEQLRQSIDKVFEDYRDKANHILGHGYHRRAPSNVADLMLGIHYFLKFCWESDYLAKDKATQIKDYHFNNLIALAKLQPVLQNTMDIKTLVRKEMSSYFRENFIIKDFSQISSINPATFKKELIALADYENKKLYILLETGDAVVKQLPGYLVRILKCGPKSFWKVLKKHGLLVEWDSSAKKNYIRKMVNGKKYKLYSLAYFLLDE